MFDEITRIDLDVERREATVYYRDNDGVVQATLLTTGSGVRDRVQDLFTELLEAHLDQ